MRQLMSQHSLAGVALRSVLTGLKNHIAPDRVGMRLYRTR